MQSLVRRQTVFAGGMLVCGCLEAAIAFGLVGIKGAEGVAYSVLLCLIPGWLTIYVSELLKLHDLAAYVVLVGTGFRMMFVLLGFFVVGMLRPDLGFQEFVVWLIANYLVSLGLETWTVLAPSSPETAR